MKKTGSNAYFKRLGLFLKSNLSANNLINTVNTWAVAVVWNGGGLIDWIKKELNEMDRKISHLFVEKAFLHAKAITIRVCTSRKDSEHSLVRIEECVANKYRSPDFYLASS